MASQAREFNGFHLNSLRSGTGNFRTCIKGKYFAEQGIGTLIQAEVRLVVKHGVTGSLFRYHNRRSHRMKHTYWRSQASFRVRIALRLKGLVDELVSLDLLKDDQFDSGSALARRGVLFW